MLILAQTDTTVGFLSKDPQGINRAKKRPLNQAIIQTLPSLKSLHKRVPKKFRTLVRRSKQTTFTLSPSFSFRIVDSDNSHHSLLEHFQGLYSSSANENKKKFNRSYAFDQADLIIEDKRGLYEAPASEMIKLGIKRQRRLR